MNIAFNSLYQKILSNNIFRDFIGVNALNKISKKKNVFFTAIFKLFQILDLITNTGEIKFVNLTKNYYRRIHSSLFLNRDYMDIEDSEFGNKIKSI